MFLYFAGCLIGILLYKSNLELTNGSTEALHHLVSHWLHPNLSIYRTCKARQHKEDPCHTCIYHSWWHGQKDNPPKGVLSCFEECGKCAPVLYVHGGTCVKSITSEVIVPAKIARIQCTSRSCPSLRCGQYPRKYPYSCVLLWEVSLATSCDLPWTLDSGVITVHSRSAYRDEWADCVESAWAAGRPSPVQVIEVAYL